MKLTGIFAAALVMVTGVAPVVAPAAAQRTVVHERTVVRHDVGPRYRNRTTTRRVCRTERRHGHRERVCRVVRVRS